MRRSHKESPLIIERWAEEKREPREHDRRQGHAPQAKLSGNGLRDERHARGVPHHGPFTPTVLRDPGNYQT